MLATDFFEDLVLGDQILESAFVGVIGELDRFHGVEVFGEAALHEIDLAECTFPQKLNYFKVFITPVLTFKPYFPFSHGGRDHGTVIIIGLGPLAVKALIPPPMILIVPEIDIQVVRRALTILSSFRYE